MADDVPLPPFRFPQGVTIDRVRIRHKSGSIVFIGTFNKGAIGGWQVEGSPEAEAELAKMMDDGWTVRQYYDFKGLKHSHLVNDCLLSEIIKDPRDVKPPLIVEESSSS